MSMFWTLILNIIRLIQLWDKKNLTFVDCWGKIILNPSWKFLLSSPKARLLTFSKTRFISTFNSWQILSFPGQSIVRTCLVLQSLTKTITRKIKPTFCKVSCYYLSYFLQSFQECLKTLDVRPTERKVIFIDHSNLGKFFYESKLKIQPSELQKQHISSNRAKIWHKDKNMTLVWIK